MSDQQHDLLAVERGGSYAPCSWILCRVTNPEAGKGYYDWNERDDDNTILHQTDWEFPSLAQMMGWDKGARADGCDHDGSDGTVDCKDCGKTASEFISEADDFLEQCSDCGKVVPDYGELFATVKG